MDNFPELDRWVASTDPYCEPRGASKAEEDELIASAKALMAALPDPDIHTHHDLWTKSYHVRNHVWNLSAQFLFDSYTDSNTDEPCDVEWDVWNLLKDCGKTDSIPTEVVPAYVGNIYPGPDYDEEA